MWVVDAYWAPEKCGRLTPPARHAHAVRPEQSNEFGPAAPHAYGLPSCRWAAAMAAPAPPLADGGGPAGADGAAPPPKLPVAPQPMRQRHDSQPARPQPAPALVRLQPGPELQRRPAARRRPSPVPGGRASPTRPGPGCTATAAARRLTGRRTCWFFRSLRLGLGGALGLVQLADLDLEVFLGGPQLVDQAAGGFRKRPSGSPGAGPRSSGSVPAACCWETVSVPWT